jgi:inner membrane protein
MQAATTRDEGFNGPGLTGRRLAFKAIVVGFLTLLLLVPLALINGTIQERQAYRRQAVAAVAGSFAGAQQLTGPVLVVPYTDESQVEEKDRFGNLVLRTERDARHVLLFPASMDLRGRLTPSVRRRGLHEVRVYELQSSLDARFDASLPGVPSGVKRSLGTPYLSFSIADVRGLVGSPVLTVNQRPVGLRQGRGGHLGGPGLHAILPGLIGEQRLRLRLRFESVLGGTESLAIAPVADSNTVSLSSSWPHPQFAGRFLPRTRRISEAGFSARWELSSLAAGTQEQVRQGADAVDMLSVSLVEPVNAYSQADRATKYGVLFVMLTFVAFFMFELLKRLPIHPIQYGLVGLSLAIFFLLLISLSEHLAFWIAYLVASVACIGLLGVYLSAVLRSARRGLGFAAGLTLLYAALYGLLVSEDNALVLGSLMLFAILATLMLVTRRVDWYAPASTLQADAG